MSEKNIPRWNWELHQSPAIGKSKKFEYGELKTSMGHRKGNVTCYRVTAEVSSPSANNGSVKEFQQEIQLISLPVFQFGIFYTSDLEINPRNNLTILGPVHSNGNIYIEPHQSSLVFKNSVTSAQNIYHHKHPEDPLVRQWGRIRNDSTSKSRINSLVLPIGLVKDRSEFRSISEIPPENEDPFSARGLQRYYNKADLILILNDEGNRAFSGAHDDFSINIPWTLIEISEAKPGKGKPEKGKRSGFLDSDVQFFDKREYSTVRAVEINLEDFLKSHKSLSAALGHPLRTLYIADLRKSKAGFQSGVRLINGQSLPKYGLTIATLNPIYIQGDYNRGKGIKPASIAADSVTLLSKNWEDDHNTLGLDQRRADSTVINAAIITGTVPTGNGHYSGGVENAVRLLENWRYRSLTIKGSLAVLFDSELAISPWGIVPGIYSPPVRNFIWNEDFEEIKHLPPSTPELYSYASSFRI